MARQNHRPHSDGCKDYPWIVITSTISTREVQHVPRWGKKRLPIFGHYAAVPSTVPELKRDTRANKYSELPCNYPGGVAEKMSQKRSLQIVSCWNDCMTCGCFTTFYLWLKHAECMLNECGPMSFYKNLFHMCIVEINRITCTSYSIDYLVIACRVYTNLMFKDTFPPFEWFMYLPRFSRFQLRALKMIHVWLLWCMERVIHLGMLSDTF